MVGVMSFSNEKREQFSRCPKCYAETKHQSIKSSDLSFGEVLDRVTNQHNQRKGR